MDPDHYGQPNSPLIIVFILCSPTHNGNIPAAQQVQFFFKQCSFYCCTLFTFQLAFILSVSLFNKVFWFIVEGCLYFVLIIGCYWKDEFHWFCGWLGALLGQTIDCQQGLCWVRIDASESSPLLFIYFCLHWLKHAIVQRLLSHWR